MNPQLERDREIALMKINNSSKRLFDWSVSQPHEMAIPTPDHLRDAIDVISNIIFLADPAHRETVRAAVAREIGLIPPTEGASPTLFANVVAPPPPVSQATPAQLLPQPTFPMATSVAVAAPVGTIIVRQPSRGVVLPTPPMMNLASPQVVPIAPPAAAAAASQGDPVVPIHWEGLRLRPDQPTGILTAPNGADEFPRPRKKRGRQGSCTLMCRMCGTTETTEWRRGPDNCKSLCNACGLHYAKIVKKEQQRTVRERHTVSVSTLLNT